MSSGPGVLFPLYLPIVNGKELEWQDDLARRAATTGLAVNKLSPMVLSSASYDSSAATGVKADIPGVFITEPSSLPNPVSSPVYFPTAIVRPTVRLKFNAP